MDNLQMTSDDEYVAIQRLQHPITGVTVYLPMGQELPDTKQRSSGMDSSLANTMKMASTSAPSYTIRTTSAYCAGS